MHGLCVRLAVLLALEILCEGLLFRRGCDLNPDNADARARKEWTLGQFRAKYLGQRVLIMHGHDIAGNLAPWQPVLPNGEGSFRNDYNSGAFISVKYRDQTPKIIAIQNSGAKKSAQANIMGDAVSDDNKVGASVIIIAQFDDGQLAEFSSIVSLIVDERVTTHRGIAARSVILTKIAGEWNSC